MWLDHECGDPMSEMSVFIKDPGEHPCPFCHENIGQEVCHPEEDLHLTVLAPFSRISSLHKCGKYMPTACLAFCCSSLNGPRQTTGYYWQRWRGRWTKVLGHGIWNLWFGSWFPSYAMLEKPKGFQMQTGNDTFCVYQFVVIRVKVNSINTTSELNLCVHLNSLLLENSHKSTSIKKREKHRPFFAMSQLQLQDNGAHPGFSCTFTLTDINLERKNLFTLGYLKLPAETIFWVGKLLAP